MYPRRTTWHSFGLNVVCRFVCCPACSRWTPLHRTPLHRNPLCYSRRALGQSAFLRSASDVTKIRKYKTRKIQALHRAARDGVRTDSGVRVRPRARPNVHAPTRLWRMRPADTWDECHGVHVTHGCTAHMPDDDDCSIRVSSAPYRGTPMKGAPASEVANEGILHSPGVWDGYGRRS